MSTQASLSLRIHDAHGAYRDVEILNFPASVGRQEGCDVWIDDPKVSREHLRIELRDAPSESRAAKEFVCVDLGSSNGFRWQGKNTRKARLAKDGRLRVGESRIEIRALTIPRDVPKAPSRTRRSESAATEPVVLDSVRARRQRIRLGGVAIVACLVLGVGYYVSTKVVGRSTADPDRLVAMQDEVETLRARLAKDGRVTPKFMRLLDETVRNYDTGAATPDGDEGAEPGSHPLREFQSYVRQQYTLEQRAIIGDAMTKKRELLAARKFGELHAYLQSVVDSFDGERNNKLTLAGLLRDTDAAIEREFQDVIVDLNYLESGVAGPAEINTMYDESLASFAGTSFADQISERRAQRPADAVTSVVADVNPDTAETGTASQVPERADPDGRLLALVRTALETPGILGRRSYPFSVFAGKPLRIDDSGVLTIATTDDDAETEKQMPFARVSKATRLLIAHDALSGDPLLEAVDVAFVWGHDVVAGKMLQRYVEEVTGKEARRERRDVVNAILLKSRGFASLPDGGFEYHEKYGWETEGDRNERVVLVAVEKMTERFSARTKAAALEESVDKIAAHLANEELSDHLRRRIRKLTIESLQGLRETLAADIGKNVTKLLAPLRAEKVELNVRREAAKKLIYDAEIYLPEDHPDWTKGDRINGQLAVDEKVRAVREIWNAAEKKTIPVPKAAWRAVTTISKLDSELLPRFGIRAPKESDPRLADLLRNPYPLLNVRNFSLDDDEAKIYRFSRKVEEYNRAFVHEDLSAQDQEHCYIMNDYRELFGHQRCFIDIRICRATKKHSAVCDNAGEIWHDGPNGTPQSRAQAEGFEYGVAENVAIGYANPKAIWDQGWYRASDHHRNALAYPHNCIGYGYVGRVGTQNFATIDPPFEVQ